MRGRNWIFLLLILPGLLACNRRELAADLKLSEANEIIAILQQYGLNARAEAVAARGDKRYHVAVAEADFPRALELMRQHGLPRDSRAEMLELIAGDVLSPVGLAAEAQRRDWISAQGIERLLNALAGVLETRVLLNAAQARSAGSLPTATVLVRYAARTHGPSPEEAEIRQLVSQSIPGLAAAEVRVKFERVNLAHEGPSLYPGTALYPLRPFLFRVPLAEMQGAQRQLAVMFLLIAVCGVVVGYYLGLRAPNSSDSDLPEPPTE